LSRIIGLVREQVIGRTLGATREADLYFASFTIPDFLNYLLAAGALSIVFIPIFLEHLQKGDRDQGWRSFSVIANVILLFECVAIALMMWFARPLANVVAPGFTSAAEVDALVRLTRIILPAQFFHVLGGLLSAALQAHDLHVIPALAPLVYSASIIAGGLIGAQLGAGADGFAWGVLVGSFIGPFALPLYGCLRIGLRWQPILSWNIDLKRYLWLSAPIMLGFSIVMVDEWIVKNQASYLAPGVLSYLQYGRTLMKVPIGVFGMAAGVAAYPTISRLIAAGSVAEAYGLLARAVRMMLMLTFAAQICLTVAGFEAVYFIWGLFANRFTADDAQATATILTFLCLGLGGWAAQTVISRGLYAMGRTWLPTLLGTLVAFAMIPVYVVLRQHWGANGLATASAVAIVIYVFVLGFVQRQRFAHEAQKAGRPLDDGMLGGALRLAAAAAAACGAGLALRPPLLAMLPGLSLPALIGRAFILCALALTVYAIAARLLGVREIPALLALLRRRIWRR
jgi:putative peptidoglycan lipid II flippase